MKIILVLFTICSFGSADELIDQLEICKRSDPNLNSCLKNAIQKFLPLMEYGIPEFNIPSMQPVHVPTWIIKKKLPELTFDQRYSNLTIYNLPNSTLISVESTITDTDFFLRLKLHNPFIKFRTEYDYKDAIILGQNISGQGYAYFVEIGNDIEMNITGRVTPKGDKTVLQHIDVDLEVKVDHVEIDLNHYHFEFNRENSEHLNKHSPFFVEISEGYFNMIIVDIKRACNAIFSQIDYNKLFPK